MQEQDFQWYLDHFEDLYNQYGRKFVAIKNKCVLGVYDSYVDAVRVTLQIEPIGTFIVQECGPDESAYTEYIASMNFCD